MVGYVGQTGWATGPHLHYEFRVADAAVNPLTIPLPAALPLDAKYLADFKGKAAPLGAAHFSMVLAVRPIRRAVPG